MKFAKDILVIDFEGTNDEPVQIGAILLDKETLAEKDNFLSYIYADLKGERAYKSEISQEMLVGAPTPAEVGKMVFDKFGTDLFIATWVANYDMRCFEKIMAAADIAFNQYDYHIFDIWPAAYLYLLKQGYTGEFRSEGMFQKFGATARELHNALQDCRIAADVLRKISL